MGRRSERTDNDRAKLYGEVMTPPELVNEILDKFPGEVWGDPDETWLEPCCGHGNFVVEVLRRHVVAGLDPHQALRTMYAVELLPDNVIVTRLRALETVGVADPIAKLIVCCHIRQGNTLEDDLSDDAYWAEPQNITLPLSYVIGSHNRPWLTRWRPETLMVLHNGRPCEIVL